MLDHKNIVFRVPTALRQALEVYAKKQERTLSQVIRIAVKEFLEKHNDEKS